MTVAILRPDSNSEMNYYSVYKPRGQTGTNCVPGEWKVGEYGLSITHFAHDPDYPTDATLDVPRRLLTHDVRAGQVDMLAGWDGRGAFPGTATESTYAQYEYDGVLPSS